MPSKNWSTLLAAEDWQAGGFGLYIHWPFCLSKCPYCDFNSHVAESVDRLRWERAFLTEIDRIGAKTPVRTLNSIFFGGGTPSLMDPDLVRAIIQRARATWISVNDLEVTLEANPTSVEAGRFSAYRDAGVTRVSLGIQALRDADLRRLGRLHSSAEARAAFDIARDRFSRVSFDLIYGRQDQTLQDWHRELSEALAMAADHLSLYQLTIEPGTAFGDRLASGRLHGLPDEDTGADLYELTQALCERAGLPAYEISNHARPGAESRHNLIYWRYGDYAGIGPGAHGRMSLHGRRFATEALSRPDAWLEAVETRGSGERPPAPLSTRDQAEEYLMMGLRLRDGISLARYEAFLGSEISSFKINGLADLGLIEAASGRLFATPAGRAVLNGIIRELLPETD
ncbi:oxygen-independent coproporphyrinogen-3 oxidase [Rhodovulum imhoffii]|uniref:Heme chaperone HemW n=1 Tax=Rhodovulum imhoffii TaxID=365340 RepID=A0A2T5BRK0_9RHOB|nr:radical SAM family heme chaperone HemW [Rhodovulum imhoffii]PTN01912.1 oxygen-independent coproporphyrinogen-3 oxidase [Rhodovulum imhoffii]